MNSFAAPLALAALAAWAYLLAARGGFWRCMERDDRDRPQEPAHWPAVTAVVPARNEADMVERSLAALLQQRYPGSLSVVVVDDNSDDGTFDRAREAAASAGQRVQVVQGAPLPAGWTGKLWALEQGVARAEASAAPPEYLLLMDADIECGPEALRTLAARAEAGELAMASLMAKLRCESAAERVLIPAFIFFFQMLYPFSWVNRQGARTAAAAGGFALVRRTALARAGGIGSIRGALIDDCTLAARLKRHGPLWLGLTEQVRSLRPYPGIGDIRRMVARSAYAQLRFSPWLLGVTGAGMALVYLAAPAIAIFGTGVARWAAAAAWLAMAIAFLPTLRFYRLSAAWAPLLPFIAAMYLGFTLDSALQHARGRAGLWKGRVQALPQASK
ncbi:MAG: glycosyltransferase [Burkholderiaceae bacterium]|nr:glycosyltransferase [Burkholderiaceae bacterium]